MEELWKDIEGYEGLYQVSSLGRVKSVKKVDNLNRKVEEKILKPGNNDRGYLQVSLYKNGKVKRYYVHRLVAQAFIPNDIPERNCIDHIDTNTQNNTIQNLRWCTSKENNNNELTKKHFSEAMKGENNPMYGKHHSEETKRKLGEVKSGENNPFYGKHHTEESKQKMRKPVVGVNIKTGEVICLDGASQGEELGFNQSHITGCCRGKRKTHKGYYWYYKENYKK